MKRYILFFALVFSVQTRAQDSDVFKDVYPQFYNFQTLLFVELKGYFENLPARSVIFSDASGLRIFNVSLKNSNSIKIYSKINRTFKPSEIREVVVYSLDNGQHFSFEVIKRGSKIAATNDEDLLAFRFAPSQEEQYQINIPNFNIHVSLSRSFNKTNSLFALGFMELNFKIEMVDQPDMALLNYIIFFKNIKPSPQALLSVKANKLSQEFADVIYTHYASNGGELTPKQFFMALGDGSKAFSQASAIMAKALLQAGFPKLD